MKKIVKLVFFLCLSFQMNAQELFVFTEPASNIPANVLSTRLMSSFYKERYESGTNIHFMPEIRYGISSKLMVQGQAFISNRNENLVYEGGGFYAQYKFLNNDEVKKHFRMAAYGRVSFNNADIHQEEIETVGHNSGFEAGIIGTQLLHKVAISSSLSFEQAMNNESYRFPDEQSNSAINYTLSVGKLMLPKKYTGYDQTNFNLMLEFLGQRLNENGKSYLDIAPSVQFILFSRARLDLGYRHELYSTMYRSAPNGFTFRLEYNFYNVF
ncbi:hypothetical protein [Flavobacterium sp. GT3R68]|uniref:hypothetical protein n=1 Tax=Flavobacterium sp. GT3R68 TaxID=2594437 RepID=UPI000F8842F0|nr:hypothetical protein [Flavobacterium sp. GT3R68]RTY89849.1 hypothetical protein EKL32_22105 [Flavobacterium sp. GSN2]TRW89828.1 hypothetical protein FNW07_12335 [Flavobacterium sp. GT3R68]